MSRHTRTLGHVSHQPFSPLRDKCGFNLGNGTPNVKHDRKSCAILILHLDITKTANLPSANASAEHGSR